MSTIEQNLRLVQQRIAEAATRASRDPNDITLVAVSKTFPAEAVLEAYAAGARQFGENRVEEAAEKFPILNAVTQNVVWHLVGHLQSRKVKDAARLFDVIQSVDSIALARRLSERAAIAQNTVRILLEVNVSGETTKYGFTPEQRADFLRTVGEILTLAHIEVQGLMTVAPIVQDPNDTRPVFRALRQLRDELRTQFPNHAWQHLSMGMTDDFPVAVAEGATIVRIGRAIFGERK